MLLPKFLLLTAFLEFASAICADSNDQEIKGFCFKFVTQQLTFTDARTWCHLKNPVGPSYLAYVPSQDTSTYLACEYTFRLIQRVDYYHFFFNRDIADFGCRLVQPADTFEIFEKRANFFKTLKFHLQCYKELSAESRRNFISRLAPIKLIYFSLRSFCIWRGC